MRRCFVGKRSRHKSRCRGAAGVAPQPRQCVVVPLQPANPHPQPSFGQPIHCIRMGFQCPSAPPLLGGAEDVGTKSCSSQAFLFEKKKKTQPPKAKTSKRWCPSWATSTVGSWGCSASNEEERGEGWIASYPALSLGWRLWVLQSSPAEIVALFKRPDDQGRW